MVQIELELIGLALGGATPMQPLPAIFTNQIVRTGLLGQRIGQSRTPAMHMKEANDQGFECDYSFIDMADAANVGMTLSTMLDRVESEGYAGINVTYPYKIDIIPLLDELSPNAAAVGAVNTVVLKGGKRTGHNTDMWGFAEAFRREFGSGPHDHTLLIGAGGAGAAVAHGLADCGVKRLTIYDTDPVRAAGLASQVSAKWSNTVAVPTTDLPTKVAQDRPDGIVNATPVGMDSLPGSAFPLELLTPEMWVADIVYFPLETELLRTARLQGCRTLDGSGMAIFQAVRAFQFFTGRPADPKRMKARFDAFNTTPRNGAG